MGRTPASSRWRRPRHRSSVGAGFVLIALVASCRLNDLLSPPHEGGNGGPPGAGRLEFAVQPGSANVAEPLQPPPEIVVLDSAGNPDTTFTGTVRIALDANGRNARLLGTTSRPAVKGVVVFTGIAVDLEGEGYRLVASADSARTATSAPFAVMAPGGGGEPTTIARVSGNGQEGTVGEALDAPYVVRVTDAGGDPVPGTTVTWAVTAGGGSMSPISTTTDANGQASATHTLGTGPGAHSVRATVAGLTPVTFTSTAIAGAADVLVFTVQPSDSDVDEAITPAVEITAEDAHGNRATGFAGTVTLTLGGGGGGSLGGTTSRAASAGVVTFPGLTVDRAGTGYRLTAAATGVSTATSAAFDIAAPGGGGGEPTAIAIVSGNGQSGAAGEALGSPYVVRVTDAGGAPVAGALVSWAVTAGGGSVSPGSSTTNASGQASATHTLGPGTGSHSVRATVAGLTPVTFTSTAVAGPAVVLVFTVQPSDSDVDEAITPAVEITARDAHGNRATNFTGTVTLTLGGGGGGSLGGTTARTAAAGIVTFPGLSVDEAGTGYRLSATAAGLSGATSAPFDVTAPGGGGPTSIVIVSGNGQSGTVGEELDAPYVVRVTDAAGDPVAGVTVTWAVTSGGGSVSPTSSTTNANGQASATHTLGTGTGAQSVRATAAGLSPVTFTSTAVAGTPDELVFTTQPSDAGYGETISPPVRVTVLDRYGNVVTNFSGSITLSIAPLTGTPLANLNGTRTRQVSGGTATFSDLSIDLVGVDYKLRASGAGLTADSAPFDILL